MNPDLISIIVASYNCAAFLGDTIDSIRAQSYLHWELLITDDASTDETVALVRKYQALDSRIKLFCLTENSGTAMARNHSIHKAQGRFLAFCDSDDYWAPTKLEEQRAFMLENDCVFSYTDYYEFDVSGICRYVSFPSRIDYFYLLRDCVGCLTVMYDAGRIGKFYMPLLRKRQDWGMWLTIIRQCKVACGISRPLAYYRVRKNSLSSDKLRLVKYNVDVYRRVLGFSRVKAYLVFSVFFLPTYVMKICRKNLSRFYLQREKHG